MNMNRIIISLFTFLVIPIYVWGQSDRYSDIHETIGQTIQMYDMDKLYNEYQPFIYKRNNKGKLVREKELTVYTQLHNKHLSVVGIETIKKKTYWILDNGQEQLMYLLISDIDYCRNIKSVSYWEQEFDNLALKYLYYISSEASKDVLDSYQQIHWNGLVMPSHIDENPSFSFETTQKGTTLVIPSKINNDNGFFTQEEYTHIKSEIEERIRLEEEKKRLEAERLLKEQERKDSIADFNHIIQVRIARKPISYTSFKQNGVFEDAPRFEHLHLDIYLYSKPSKYTTYSIEREWDYYLTIFNYDPETKRYIGYCKGKVLTLPKEALANRLSIEDEKYLLRRATKGIDIRKRAASEYDKQFYASSKHLDNIMDLKPDNKSTSTNDIIGRKYIVKKEYFYFQDAPLRVIATNEELRDNVSRKELFTCVDIVHQDNTLSSSYDIVIFENPKYGYCWLSSYYYINSYLDEYKTVVKNQQKRKEWEQRMIEKWGEVNGKTIIQGKVRVGFTAEMCRDSWGKPSTINRTTTAYGTHEQWVYGYGNYLYFEDGILTTIQN